MVKNHPTVMFQMPVSGSLLWSFCLHCLLIPWLKIMEHVLEAILSRESMHICLGVYAHE